jgi:hypothetical protein
MGKADRDNFFLTIILVDIGQCLWKNETKDAVAEFSIVFE